MSKKEISYYLIEDCLLAKEEDKKYYLFKKGKWEPDTKKVVWNHFIGFDSSEDIDSPYAFEDLDVMDSIVEISEDKARNFAPEAF